MLSKANAIIVGAVGVLMILMSLHMMGHDGGWYLFGDMIMAAAGLFDIAIGYKLFMED